MKPEYQQKAGAETMSSLKTKLSAKQFIKLKQMQLKQTHNNSQTFTHLRSLIAAVNPIEFELQLNQLKPQLTILFLFSQNEFKQICLADLFRSDHYETFLTPINTWCSSNTEAFNTVLKGVQNQLAKGDWSHKYISVSKAICQQFLKIYNQSRTESTLLNLLGQQNGLFFQLSLLYMDLQAVITVTNSFKTPDLLLKHLYLPLIYVSSLNKVLSSAVIEQIQAYYNYRFKDRTWIETNFLEFLSEVDDRTVEILRLDEISFNFWHELSETGSTQFLQILDILPVQFKNSPKMYQQLVQMLQVFDTANQTPIDKCLKLWKSSSIQQLIKLAQNHDKIRLSTSCLLKIISNHRLNRYQKDKLIVECLTGPLSKKGYLNRLPLKQSKQLKMTKKQKGSQNQKETFCFCEVDMLTSTTNIQYGQLWLLTHQQSNYYPLIAYLQAYKDKSTISTLQILMLPSLQKTAIRSKLGDLMQRATNRTLICPRDSELHKEVSFLLQFYQPLWKCLCRLPHGEVLQNLLSCVFFNTYQIRILREESVTEFQFFGNHFIRFYIENTPFLGKDDINQLIFNTLIDDRPESSPFLHNLAVRELELIKSLNSLQKFNYLDDYLVVNLRNRLKHYLNIMPPEELMKPIAQWNTLTLFDVICSPFAYESPSILSIHELVDKYGEPFLRQYSTFPSNKAQANLNKALKAWKQNSSQKDQQEV